MTADLFKKAEEQVSGSAQALADNERRERLERSFYRHEAGDSAYSHANEKARASVLGVAVLLTLSFSAIELLGGFWANSLALIGDAGHMATDSASLLLALIANRIALKGADHVHNYGHGRVEVVAAFVNALIMFGVVIWLFVEACERIQTPQDVAGGSVMMIAFAGFLINVGVAWSLSRDRKNMNARAALLHVMGDLLGSVAAIAAGCIIMMGGPTIIDPILSMFVGVMLLHAIWTVLRDSVRVLLDSTPEGIEYVEVGELIQSIPNVERVHDLHVWTMSPGHGAVQCHVSITSPECWPVILNNIRTGIREKFGIDHVTVQPEWACGCECESCRGQEAARPQGASANASKT